MRAVRYVFDLDGTIVDNRRAIEEAYRAAGVTIMRWHRPWREWCTPVQHNKKAELYPFFLNQFGRFTELGKNLLHRGQPLTVLTGASRTAVDHVLNWMPSLGGLLPAETVYCGMTPRAKADWLALNGWGIYVDDEAECRRIIRETTTWEVIRPSEAVRRLFSPPAPTRG